MYFASLGNVPIIREYDFCRVYVINVKISSDQPVFAATMCALHRNALSVLRAKLRNCKRGASDLSNLSKFGNEKDRERERERE